MPVATETATKRQRGGSVADLSREDFYSAFKDQQSAADQHSRDQLHAINGLAAEIRSLAATRSGTSKTNGNAVAFALFSTCITLIFSLAGLFIYAQTTIVGAIGTERQDRQSDVEMVQSLVSMEREDRITRDKFNHDLVSEMVALSKAEQTSKVSRLERYGDQIIFAVLQNLGAKASSHLIDPDDGVLPTIK